MSRILGTDLPVVYYDNQEATLSKPSSNGRDEQFIEENVSSYINLLKELVRRSDGFRLNCRYIYEYISETDLQTLLAISRATRIEIKFATIPAAYPVWMVIEERGNAAGRLWGDSIVIRFRGKKLSPGYPDPDAMSSIAPYQGFGPIVN